MNAITVRLDAVFSMGPSGGKILIDLRKVLSK